MLYVIAGMASFRRSFMARHRCIWRLRKFFPRLDVLARSYAGMGSYGEAVTAGEKTLAWNAQQPAGRPTAYNRGVAERALARYRAQLKNR